MEIKRLLEENTELLDNGNWVKLFQKLPVEHWEKLEQVLRVASIFNLTVDAANIPAALTPGDFERWLKKIVRALANIGSSTKIPDDISIIFSDEEKIKAYGSTSFHDIISEIRRRWQLDKKASDLLDEIQSRHDDSGRQLASVIAEILIGCNPGKTYDEIRRELEELFDDLRFDVRVMGEYRNSSKTIVLYTKNIETAAVGKRTVEQAYEVVFAHEFFHAYHYCGQDDDSEIVRRRDYTSTVVKESLASAFEWFYCEENKIDGADKLMSDWNSYSVFTYPYSGAENLISWENYSSSYVLDKNTFADIFEKSTDDMDGALRLLLCPDDFYNIKNAITVCTRRVILPVTSAPGNLKDFIAAHEDKNVGRIAREEIPPIIKAKPHLITDLMDRGYCKSMFNFDSYPILSTVKIYSGGKCRVYANPIKIGGVEYFICNNWREYQNRIPLLYWLWDNRL